MSKGGKIVRVVNFVIELNKMILKIFKILPIIKIPKSCSKFLKIKKITIISLNLKKIFNILYFFKSQ